MPTAAKTAALSSTTGDSWECWHHQLGSAVHLPHGVLAVGLTRLDYNRGEAGLIDCVGEALQRDNVSKGARCTTAVRHDCDGITSCAEVATPNAVSKGAWVMSGSNRVGRSKAFERLEEMSCSHAGWP